MIFAEETYSYPSIYILTLIIIQEMSMDYKNMVNDKRYTNSQYKKTPDSTVIPVLIASYRHCERKEKLR
jgi:hypothetical protein